jgi:F-type H+-transporting ATPase subunit b
MIKLSLGTFIMMVINFLVLMFVLVRLLYRPIQNILEQRKQRISADLSNAQNSREKWEQMRQEAKVSLEKAQTEAFEMVERARNEAEKVRENLLNQARREAEELRIRTQSEIERAKRIAGDELKEGVVTLALAAATKVIGGKMSRDINDTLIRQALDSIDKGAG